MGYAQVPHLGVKGNTASKITRVFGAGKCVRVPPRSKNPSVAQRYTYRVLQTIQMKLKPLCVWAERAVLGSAKTAVKFKYEI